MLVVLVDDLELFIVIHVVDALQRLQVATIVHQAVFAGVTHPPVQVVGASAVGEMQMSHVLADELLATAAFVVSVTVLPTARTHMSFIASLNSALLNSPTQYPST